MKNIFSRIYHRLEPLIFERFMGDFIFPRVLAPLLRYPSRTPPVPSLVKTVLVWNIDSPGDTLWITPSLRALRELYPQAKISMICNRGVTAILETNPNIDELIPVSAQKFYSARGFFSPIVELTDRRFDVFLILEMGPRPADRARLIGRKLKGSYIVAGHAGHLKKCAHFTLPPNGVGDSEYWPRYFRSAVEHLGAPTLKTSECKLELFPDEKDQGVIDRKIQKWNMEYGERAVVIFHPGVAPYAALTKKWPAGHFVVLAKELLAKREIRILVSGDTAEIGECRKLVSEIVAATNHTDVHSLAGELTLREFSVLLARSAVVVTADTAALHLALAADSKIVALFGATDPWLIAPRSENCVVLREEMPCSPCHRPRDFAPFWPTCIFEKQECMWKITPMAVAHEIEARL